MSAAIEAENLSKHYGDIEAVSDLSFSFAEKQVIGLLGPNGAGKTTTMRILTTFLAPSAGTARVAGFDVCREAEEVVKHIGYLPESPPLYPELKVKEYISFIARIKGVSGKAVQSSVSDAISRCNLDDVADRLCGNLSKGYRQRVGLAAALVHQPKVIILDEPTSGLDPAQIIEIRKLIKSLGESHTVLLSTHILPEVSETCSRVAIICRGQLVEEASVEELTKDKGLEEKFLEAVAGTSPLAAQSSEEVQ